MKSFNIDWLVACIAVACVITACVLSGCGGGQATAEEIAQHDADMQAATRATIQKPDCSTGACK